METVNKFRKYESTLALFAFFVVLYTYFATEINKNERTNSPNNENDYEQVSPLLEPSFDVTSNWILFLEETKNEPTSSVLEIGPYVSKKESTFMEELDGSLQTLQLETADEPTPKISFVYVKFEMNTNPPSSWMANQESQKKENAPKPENLLQQPNDDKSKPTLTVEDEDRMEEAQVETVEAENESDLDNESEILIKDAGDGTNRKADEQEDETDKNLRIKGELK